MGYKVDEIEGIGPSSTQKLDAAGIRSTDDLLELCATPAGRKAIAEKTGLSETHILGWTNAADLMRVSGIGGQYAELLEAAGVDTIKELRNRNADNLVEKMQEVNEARRLTRSTPSSSMVRGWVDQAKRTDPKISY